MTSQDCIREGSGTGCSAPKGVGAWQVDANHLDICWTEGLLQSRKLSHGVWLCGTLHCAYLLRCNRDRYEVIYDHILLWPNERLLIDSPSPPPPPLAFCRSMIICTSPLSAKLSCDRAGQTDMHHTPLRTSLLLCLITCCENQSPVPASNSLRRFPWVNG